METEVWDSVANGLFLIGGLGTGNGKFAQQQDCGIGVDLRETIVEDFNGDGKADIATLLWPKHSVSVMLGSGGCGFAAGYRGRRMV